VSDAVSDVAHSGRMVPDPSTYHAAVLTDSDGLPPRIGLTAYRERAAWGAWDEAADLLPISYADAVSLAGGAPVLLPVPGATARRSLEELASAVLGGIDGLLLTGGPDVDPASYGADRDPHTQAPRLDRDDWEFALTRAALDQGTPVLCVCRGMQTLNVALGGTLIQHLPDQVGHDEHSPTPGVHGRHRIYTAPGTKVSGVYGEHADVATYHHQAVGELAPGLVPTAWTEDRTIEAAELAGDQWVVAVQWHPEVFNGAELFADFVAASAAAYRPAGV
jgi:putative glutamine amidotransferase